MTDYSASFEGLNGRAQTSLDGAWTIFGRVVARQSLLQLGEDLDGLRRSSFALGSAESADAPEVAPLLQSEHAAEKTLETNEKSFRRSQGDQWYASMHDDLAHLLAVTESLLQLNGQLHARRQELSKEAASVAAMLPGKIAGWSRRCLQRAARPQRPPRAAPTKRRRWMCLVERSPFLSP